MRTQQDLETRIKMHNDAYRSGTPIVSDQRYDELVSELKTLYPKSELLKKGVIEEEPSTRKQTLPTRMASLDKYKNLSDIAKWLRSKGLDDECLIVITPKYHRISLVDQYEKCWTRGDGFVGQNSDKHFTQIYSLLLSHSEAIYFDEAIISKNNWKDHFEGKVNPRSDEPYKNARNTTAGLFNNDKPTDELKHVDYIRYGIADSPLSKYEQLKELNQINIANCKIATIKLKRLEVMPVQDFTDLYKSWSKDFAIDGLVFDIDDPTLRKSLGREENGNPAYARALKLPEWNEDYKTKITSHKLQTPKQALTSNECENMIVCLTGFRSDEITAYIESNGGSIVSGVSKKVTHLIVKDKNSTSSEMKKANDMGIGVMSKEEFETTYL